MSVLISESFILSTGRGCTDEDGIIVNEGLAIFVIVSKSIDWKVWLLLKPINCNGIKKNINDSKECTIVTVI